MTLPHASSNLALHERMALHEAAYPSRAGQVRALQSAFHKRWLRDRAAYVNPRIAKGSDVIETLTNLFAPFLERTEGKGVDLTPRHRNTQSRRDHTHARQRQRQRRQARVQEQAAHSRMLRLRNWLLNERAA